MADSLILLKDVRFGYAASRPVLDGVDLALYPGETMGLSGANGCGKTTLLRLMAGLLRPTGGEVWALGRTRETRSDFDEITGRIGMVFQDPDDQLFCPRVLEDVAFGPLSQGIEPERARAMAESALERLGLAGLGERTVWALSGGEKRLVALAGVLVMEPEVLLLDEPLNGLDQPSTDRVTRILADLPQAALIVSHDRRFLKKVCDRIGWIESGRVAPEPPG